MTNQNEFPKWKGNRDLQKHCQFLLEVHQKLNPDAHLMTALSIFNRLKKGWSEEKTTETPTRMKNYCREKIHWKSTTTTRSQKEKTTSQKGQEKKKKCDKIDEITYDLSVVRSDTVKNEENILHLANAVESMKRVNNAIMERMEKIVKKNNQPKRGIRDRLFGRGKNDQPR